jgi:hypothetical protein
MSEFIEHHAADRPASFDIYRRREQRQLVLQRRQRNCLHLYQYWMHPKLGFLHGRIRTWFPFTIQI